jgi:PKD repeat protein
VETPNAAEIAKVSLIRLSSVTHAFDMNARFQWLTFARESGGLRITAPAGGTFAPPGHYMLFLVNQSGIPSVARIMKVSPTSEPGPGPNAPPTATFLAGCGGLNCTFADRSNDPDGNLAGWEWSFGDGTVSSDRDPHHAYQGPGTYTVRLTARDREDASASVTRQVTVPGSQTPLGLTLTTKTQTGKQIVVLTWTRAQGQSIYIYRDGLVLQSTPNDGKQSIGRNFTGPATYIFKVCEAGSTICSNAATATFAGGDPPTNALPNAGFTPICSGGSCHFSDGSNDPDGTITAWQWDFGDGATSTQRNPTHSYGGGGVRTVRLTVTDNSGGQGITTKQITVGDPPNHPPSASFTASCSALACEFTDGSSDSDGHVAEWHWQFGDGATSTEQNPSHSYGTDGIYTVTLTVTDDEGTPGVSSQQLTAGTPPNQNPAASFTSSCINLACSFTDGSSDQDGSVTSWAWEFGDGATADVRNPSHIYAGAGTYTVGLTVRDEDGGQASTTRQVQVTAQPQPPAIMLTVSGRTDATKHYITHVWSGATGASVDFYRNGKRINSTPNDGRHTTAHTFKGTATWRVKICLVGSTTACSPERSITLSN